jgi:hypothetical protein
MNNSLQQKRRGERGHDVVCVPYPNKNAVVRAHGAGDLSAITGTRG